MAEDITISGQVRSYEQAPIHMIKVTLYRDMQVVDHVFTAEDGKYAAVVPSGAPVTVRLDTHLSLVNAREWHPSVVANVRATQDISLDRFLMRVGTVESEIAAIDALAAYQFCTLWTALEVDEHEYAGHAAARLSQMKFTTELLRDIQRNLEVYFRKLAQSP